ncbi:deoxycytidyl transferase, partial [Tieghemiomyces parasiticus]
MAARTPDARRELEPVQEYTMRQYMADKVRKLQAQGEAITGTNAIVAAEPNKPGVFLGVRVFVTGYTEPSQQELRALVFTHGGLFVHYLTPAEEITYIVATQLTPKKVQEWGGRALYRVVTPAWVVDSASAGCRLPWATYQPECMRGRGQASLLRQLTSTATSNPSSVTQPTGMATELMIRTAALPPQMAANSAIPKPTPPIPSGGLGPPGSGAKGPSRTTATDPAFLKNYYQASRLHLLSAFKSELQAYIIEQVTAAGAATGPSRPPPGPGEHRVIFYADFDCFFAAVALRSRPDLVDRPVAVSHCQDPTTQSSHSDLASCNYVARNFGIKNGMHVGRARQLCPQLVLLPYDFEAYKAISRAFYQILTEYSPHVQVGSMDEAILDVTHHFPADAHPGSSDGTAYLGLAQRLRGQVHAATGCQISVGIATSIVLAKLAARRAKPHGQFYIAPETATAVIAPLPVRDLPGVGWSNANKLATQSITTIGQLQQADPSGLADLLGPKVAQQLQRLACGKDDRLVQTHTERRSIGTEVGWGVRFERTDQVIRFLADLCREVSQRMAAAAVQGRSVVLKVKRRQSGAGEPHKHLGHGLCDTFTRTASLPLATREATVLQTACERLLRQLAVPPTELRALGIQVQKLVSDTPGFVRMVEEPTLHTFFSGPQW